MDMLPAPKGARPVAATVLTSHIVFWYVIIYTCHRYLNLILLPSPPLSLNEPIYITLQQFTYGIL